MAKEFETSHRETETTYRDVESAKKGKKEIDDHLSALTRKIMTREGSYKAEFDVLTRSRKVEKNPTAILKLAKGVRPIAFFNRTISALAEIDKGNEAIVGRQFNIDMHGSQLDEHELRQRGYMPFEVAYEESVLSGASINNSSLHGLIRFSEFLGVEISSGLTSGKKNKERTTNNKTILYESTSHFASVKRLETGLIISEFSAKETRGTDSAGNKIYRFTGKVWKLPI